MAVVGTGRAGLGRNVACSSSRSGSIGSIGFRGGDHELGLRRRVGQVLSHAGDRVRTVCIIPAHHGKRPGSRGGALSRRRHVGSIVAILL